jgi:hypothetical protein
VPLGDRVARARLGLVVVRRVCELLRNLGRMLRGDERHEVMLRDEAVAAESREYAAVLLLDSCPLGYLLGRVSALVLFQKQITYIYHAYLTVRR